MYRDKRIGLVIPAHNEETQIERTIETLPEFVDQIVVVDDGSRDATPGLLDAMAKRIDRLKVIHHEKNQGCGRARSNGYLWCRESDLDIVVGMDADGQMDPDDISSLLDPIVEGRSDYTKGNRLVTGEAWEKIPHVRYLGNSALTFLTKIASGYWHVTDSQSGFNAITVDALRLLPIDKLYPVYGWPNDLLVMLNIYGMRVMDVPIKPIYGVGEKSGIKIGRVVFSLSRLISRLFFRRMFQKYVIRDFHPLVLFYAFGGFLMLLNVPLVIRLLVLWIENDRIPPMNALSILFCSLLGFQSLLFAMLFDMETNRSLKGG